MAIGDAIVQFMGAAATDRQPAAGVEEQITSFVMLTASDELNLFDGTTVIALHLGAVRGTEQTATTRNMALMITNGIFLRKAGTTGTAAISGVQTND